MVVPQTLCICLARGVNAVLFSAGEATLIMACTLNSPISSSSCGAPCLFPMSPAYRRQTFAATPLRALDRRSSVSPLPVLPLPHERGKVRGRAKGSAADSAATPGEVLSRRKVTRDLLHGPPFRNRTREERHRRRSSSLGATGRKAGAEHG